MDPTPGNSVTIFDVAREADVSYGTVSRVLNNREHVSPQTREAVMQAVHRLGFVANKQARRLAGGPAQVIGLLLHTLTLSYVGEILRGIDTEVEASGYDLLLYTTHRRKMKELTYVSAISRGLADGLLLILPRNAGAYLDSLRASHFPVVLIDHQGSGDYERSVLATNRQGAYDATRYLLGLGHRRIGFVTGDMDVCAAVDRLAGYGQALSERGAAPDPALVYTGDFLRPAGLAGGRALLSVPQPPTAIFASNDEMAFGVLAAARERGLSIPGDLSVVGFDDIPEAVLAYPPLTTVRQPLEDMGRAATRLLTKLIANPRLEVARVELPTTLVVRDSCAPPDRPAN